jgi:hypothetical protein
MSSAGAGQGALALAEAAFALVEASPRRAAAAAEHALAAATAAGDGPARVRALHALSFAQFVLGDPRSAATAKLGIRVAARHGDRRGAGLLRRRVAYLHAMAGETRAAQREIEAAVALLDGADRWQSEVFRLEIHRRAQTADPAARRKALADAARALRMLRRDGDEIWEARLRGNRGMLLADRGELDAAEADLRRAQDLFARLGAEAAALETASSLAQLALLRGEIVTCLAMLGQVEERLPRGQLSYWLQDVRATALARARLLPEARAASEAYVALCSAAGLGDEAARATLELAEVAIMSGDAARARALAARATRSYAARGKQVNAALARAVCLRACLLDGSLRRSAMRSALEAAAVLEQSGWRREALRTRVLAARVALALGSLEPARRQLELARPLPARGIVMDRIELLHARALLALAEHQSAAAERLLLAGLGLLEDYRAALGAVELRATASGIGAELSRTGLRSAVESGRPAKILAWAERLRGNALRLPLVRPPADTRLRALQADLRRTAAAIRAAEERGKLVPGAAARQAELEAAIRTRTRLLPGERTARIAAHGASEAVGVLRERVLVEYVEHDGALGAITLAGGRLSFHELGPNVATQELEWLHFALGRLARGASSSAERAAARANVAASAARLSGLLVEPLPEALGAAPLVIVPTGPLHALPWAALPPLAGRQLVVAPSLAVWLELAGRPATRRRKTALVAGPRLRHAAGEVRDLAGLFPGATVLAGKAATAEAVLAALDGAALAHVACHGQFRADSPLFSTLELADGPLNVYELQRLRRAPEVVVLSACDLAVSGLHPGDELLGLAAALLGMGTRTIVASVVPVPDAAVRRLMLAFHRNLAGGDAPALALARAQSGGAGAGFVCLGSG